MSTKITTGKVRFSYAYLFEPQAPVSGQGDPKYNLTLLIPKSDTVTLGKIKEAIAEARDKYCARNGANALPAKPNHTLRDGDGQRDNGDDFGPECKGCYVLKVSSKRQPVIVDSFKNEITDPEEVYSGCYGRACIEFYGYNTAGQKGVTATLLSVQKLHDGERLGGTVGSADDFDDDYVDTTASDIDDIL